MAAPLMTVEIEQDQTIDFIDAPIKEQEATGVEQASAITTGRWTGDKPLIWFHFVLIKGVGASGSIFRLNGAHHMLLRRNRTARN